MTDKKTVTNGPQSYGGFDFMSNPAARFTSSSTAINGPDLFAAITSVTNGKEDEDDDWGDFVNSSGAPPRSGSLHNRSHISSDPSDPFGFTADHSRMDPSELAQPTRMEGESGNQANWVKPRGPVPLSVFGVEEEEDGEGSGALGLAGNPATGKDYKSSESAESVSSSVIGVGVNNLIADLYRTSEHSKAATANGSTPYLNNDSSSRSSTFSHKDAENSSSNVKGWEWNGLIMNGNMSNSGTATGIRASRSGLDFDLNGSDSSKKNPEFGGGPWNLYYNTVNLNTKDSGSVGNVYFPGTNVANWNPVGAHLGDVRVANLSWDPLKFKGKGSDLVKNVSNSSTNGTNLDSNGMSSGSVLGDFSEDDEWGFKAAESKAASADERTKSNEKTEDGQNSNVSIANGNMWGLDLGEISSNVSHVKGGATDLNFSRMHSEVKAVIGDAPQVMSDSDANNGDPCDDDDNGWEFKVAEPEPSTMDMTSPVEGKKLQDKKGAQNASGFMNGEHHVIDLFSGLDEFASKPIGWGFGSVSMTSSATQNRTVSNSTKDGLDLFSTNGNVVSVENSWAFKDASAEVVREDKQEPVAVYVSPDDDQKFASDDKKEPKPEKLPGPLPLSIFGDGELENDDQLVQQDISASIHASSSRKQTKPPSSNVSISDLITSLYSQAVVKPSVNLAEKPSEIGFSSAQTLVDSNLENGDGDFDDDSWEFKGAISGNGPQSQTSAPSTGDQHKNFKNKLELNDYVDFYTKLKDELHHFVLSHLENLQKARSSATDSGESARSNKLDEQIEDLRNQLYQGIIPVEVKLESLAPKAIPIDELAQALCEPKFQGLELENHLLERVLLAEKDWRATLELLKHVMQTLKILTFVSPEEQANYVSTWSRIVSVCAQELKRGSLIWKQALEKNVHGQILSKPQGKIYLLALAEIYRISEILGATSRLYKPWIILNHTTSLLISLSECTTLWSSSGLREALQSVSNLSVIDYDGSVSDLQDSIKQITSLDGDALYNHVFTGQQRTCCISLLSIGTAPGMKMVDWDGAHYFLPIANLWVNLISPDPPRLSDSHID